VKRGSLRVVLLSTLVAAQLLIPLGCGRRAQSATEIELPETPIVSIRDRWGVVTGSYVRVREEPNEGAAISDYVRRGVVVEVREVIEDARNDAGASWLKIRGEAVDGWVVESGVSLYESRARADNAARQILDDGDGE
jgi:cytochrome b